MMYACENGFSFLEKFPNSPAAGPFKVIVNGLISATQDLLLKAENSSSNSPIADVP